MIGGLPVGTGLAVLAMAAVPILTLVLYALDRRTNDGYVSVLGVE